ncbi:hypothetical protein PMIN06_008124 [Paraphaeosphaeria minitans]|uniref:Uncharacterized protein n=1 Tax=Paraphaeosphaeria minitans TaxID=565426 RepID=A0A9P6KWL0_9PLEO|nr:hypothetical protein PMIN01_00608 [Paraphaeosphaeria minitans]
MKPLGDLLCLLALSTLGVALQSKPLPSKQVSYCGYTRRSPQDKAPDCKHKLSAPCLVDNNTCSRIPANLTLITVYDECSCKISESANCSESDVSSLDGFAVTDAVLFGTLRYYKCHRLNQESGGEQMLEVGMVSFSVGIVLVMVLSGL